MKLKRKPNWLKTKKLGAKKAGEIRRKLRKYNLYTVCESAKCPNQGECFERGTATFMILGNTCTRNCTFCAVDKNMENLVKPNLTEPKKIAELSKELKLKHIVITTVTRDDLADSGVSQFVKVINEIRNICEKNVSVEVLISDLKGDFKQLKKIIDAEPDILNHNIETIHRLYPQIRAMADYERSLSVLKKVKDFNKNILTKSGFMVGLGESRKEILILMKELRKSKVDILTIGQYLAPSKNHFQVAEYVVPEIFQYYKEVGKNLGFLQVESAPLVRSSYHAEKIRKIKNPLNI